MNEAKIRENIQEAAQEEGLGKLSKEEIDFFFKQLTMELLAEVPDLRRKIEEANKILDEIPNPQAWVEEDCEDSSRDIHCDNFQEIRNKLGALREVLK